MEEQHNRECSVMVSMNLPNKARETTLLPSNEQFGGGIGGVGDTGGGGGGDEQAGIIDPYLFIYLYYHLLLPVVSLLCLSCSCTVSNTLCNYVMLCCSLICTVTFAPPCLYSSCCLSLSLITQHFILYPNLALFTIPPKVCTKFRAS